MPEERHTHYDADGNVTGWTVVERESEWLPSDYRGLQSLREYRSKLCPGGHHEVFRTHERDYHLSFGQSVCWICKADAQHERGLAAADERAVKSLGPKPSPLAPRPGDGRTTFMRFAPPGGDVDDD